MSWYRARDDRDLLARGIDYTIIGSVPPAAAEAAARDSGLN